jgi:hypothetical protein
MEDEGFNYTFILSTIITTYNHITYIVLFVPTRRLFDHFYSHFYFTNPELGKSNSFESIESCVNLQTHTKKKKGRRMVALVRKHVHFVPETLNTAAQVRKVKVQIFYFRSINSLFLYCV